MVSPLLVVRQTLPYLPTNQLPRTARHEERAPLSVWSERMRPVLTRLRGDESATELGRVGQRARSGAGARIPGPTVASRQSVSGAFPFGQRERRSPQRTRRRTEELRLIHRGGREGRR